MVSLPVFFFFTIIHTSGSVCIPVPIPPSQGHTPAPVAVWQWHNDTTRPWHTAWWHNTTWQQHSTATTIHGVTSLVTTKAHTVCCPQCVMPCVALLIACTVLHRVLHCQSPVPSVALPVTCNVSHYVLYCVLCHVSHHVSHHVSCCVFISKVSCLLKNPWKFFNFKR